MKDRRPDVEIVREVVGGKLSAYTELVERYDEVLYKVCIQICGTSEMATELAGDTFCYAYKRLNEWELLNSSFPDWLANIARRLNAGELLQDSDASMEEPFRSWYLSSSRQTPKPDEDVAES